MATTDGPGSRRPRLARSQDAYDRFSAAVDIPLTVITIAWLPVLIIPLITPVGGAVAETLDVIDYMVWALFVLEYLNQAVFVAQPRTVFQNAHPGPAHRRRPRLPPPAGGTAGQVGPPGPGRAGPGPGHRPGQRTAVAQGTAPRP